MEPTQKVPYWDVKYTDHDGEQKLAEIKARNYIQCVSEFRTIYKGIYATIHGIKQRTIATVPVLE